MAHDTNPEALFNRWSLLSIFLIAFVVVSQQLLLIRTFSVSHYYHFTYLVISTALLGFGASGTFLALFFDRLKQNYAFWSQCFCLLFLISIPFTFIVTQFIPLDTQYVLYSMNQILLLMAHNLLLFLPFFFGGTIIGYMLSCFKREVPELYGADLIGSGLGGIAAIAVILLVPASILPVILTPVILLALLVFMVSQKQETIKHKVRSSIFLILGIVVSIGAFIVQKDLRIDQYKELARFQQLQNQNDAELIENRFGPRGQIDVFESKTFHHTLFAGLHATARPPEQYALLVDGFLSGAIFRINQKKDAGIMDFTPQSLPYRLMDKPRVLLLGEITGTNIWMAKRFGAEKITVVQSNPQIISLMENDLAEESGGIFNDESVEVINVHPRLFIEQSKREFDLIQLVTGEAMAAGTGGLQGLSEDYILTRESIAGALGLLSPDGIISITRGIQSPARDNIKLISLFTDAYQSAMQNDPANHLLVSRNYLAANTILANSAITENQIMKFLDETDNLQMDPEYFPGIKSDEIDQRNIIEGPEGKNYSWIHHAILEILSENKERFYNEWIYNVETPTDDSPYFFDFFKWDSLNIFLDAYGENWFQRLELGYIILVITFLQLSVAAFVLILLPLLFRRKIYNVSKNKLPTLLHFLGIGIGFMFLEITFIQKFTLFLGDPVYSVSATLSSILVFSGSGSILQKKIKLSSVNKIRIAVGMISAVSILYLFILNPLLNMAVHLPVAGMFLVTVLLLMPLSFFLGWMFPCGMDILEKNSGELVPWAWGINGFASVTASPLAIILSMSFGFNFVIMAGIGFYLLTVFTTMLWKTKRKN